MTPKSTKDKKEPTFEEQLSEMIIKAAKPLRDQDDKNQRAAGRPLRRFCHDESRKSKRP